MRIKSENSKLPHINLEKGKKKLEITINFDNLLKTKKDLNLRLFETAREVKNDFLAGIYFSFGKFIQEIQNSNEEKAKSFINCLNKSDSCTLVYWACGSCGGNWALVDAYCGSGGSEPDYSFCELC
ncbi:hypothetical protein [Tenacibaculum xiamenense]|uniref:hypothetical protein n=1 Tax=Tenacibaculum xiamenense TaxID=1261553 RepID=UPI003893F2A0